MAYNSKNILIKARLRYLLKARSFHYRQPANFNSNRLEIEKSERRLVTILFADIVRSTDIVRRLDPEAAQELFNDILQEQIAITQRYSGTVNQVLGDGIMCLFGVEAPHTDHALRATLAASDIVKAAKLFNTKNRKNKIQVRVGVHTGMVMVSTPENDVYRAAYQVTGEPVHMTDRVMKKCAPNEVLITSDTASLLGGRIKVHNREPLVWGPEANRIGLLKPIIRDSGPFLDGKLTTVRSGKLRALEEFFSQHTAPSPACWVFLEGSAGMGKTHLVEAFCKERQDTIQLRVYFLPGERPHRETWVGYLLANELRKVVNGLETVLDLVDDPLIRDALFDLFDMPSISDTYLALKESIQKNLRVEALSFYLTVYTKRADLTLVLEDLHWASFESLSSLEMLLQNTDRIHVVASTRDPVAIQVPPSYQVLHIQLPPLTDLEADQVISEIDRHDRISKELRKHIIARSMGNPFFLKHYCTWVGTQLEQHSAPKKISQKIRSKDPDAVTDILLNQAFSLGSEVAVTAKLAAIIGLNVSFELLRLIRDISVSMLREHLRLLSKAGILEKQRELPTEEWAFSHDLLREAIYCSISVKQRKRIHRHLVDVLRSNALLAHESRYHLMAYHSSEAGDVVRTHIFSKWAARKEAHEGRHHKSIILFDQSLSVLKKLKLTQGRRHRDRLIVEMMGSLFVTAQYAKARRNLALLFEDHGRYDAQLDIRAMSFQELSLWISGDLKGALAIAEKLMKNDTLHHRSSERLREVARIANINLDLGRYETAITHDTTLIKEIAEEDGKKHLSLINVRAGAIARLAYAMLCLNRTDAAKVYFNEAFLSVENNADYFTKMYILYYLALYLMHEARYQEAKPILSEALKFCLRCEAKLILPYIYSALGVATAYAQSAREGCELTRRGLNLAKKQKSLHSLAQLKIWHAEALIQDHRSGVAARILDTVLALTTATGEEHLHRRAATVLLTATARRSPGIDRFRQHQEGEGVSF